MARKYLGHISVDVALDDVLSDLSDQDLRDELASRSGLRLAADVNADVMLTGGECDELAEAIAQGRNGEALALLDRVRAPKFKSLDACMLAFVGSKSTSAN